jgi:hypothetical protein
MIRAALIIGAAVLISGGPAAAARGGEDCRTRGRTIVANEQVRVFARDHDNLAHVYAACDLARRRARSLGRWDRGEGGVGPHFGLAGARVAYDYNECAEDGSPCGGHVDVISARTGVRRFAGQLEGPPATDLVLAGNGAVVWIRPGANGPAVTKVDRDGTVVLDDTPGVEAGSLAIAGARVYWTRGGVAQSALTR